MGNSTKTLRRLKKAWWCKNLFIGIVSQNYLHLKFTKSIKRAHYCFWMLLQRAILQKKEWSLYKSDW